MSIVQVNVSTVSAPVPSGQQKLGALISQGATTTAANAKTLLSAVGDLTALLKGALPLTSITWLASVATATTTAPHGFVTSDTLTLTIAGATPSTYNGTFLCTVTGASTFTYPLVSNPGGATSVPGTYTPEDVSELVAMNTTFFAQGSQQGVWVLELGAGNAADGVTALSAYITTNTINGLGPFYSYLVPRPWASEPTFVSLVATFETAISRTYFYTTVTNGNYASFTNAMKSVKSLVEAPGIPATEFSIGAWMQNELSRSPSSTSRVPPAAYTFLFGVTPYPQAGNAALLATYAAANVNVVGTGAEGGISDDILLYGTTEDGKDSTYWYSVDWVTINADLAISNAVINGSNNTSNPLYYNQDGINRLQAVVASTMGAGVANGLVLGQVIQTELDQTTFITNLENGLYDGLTVVNAVPFLSYVRVNPNDFPAGLYGGITSAYVPNRGFLHIIYNVVVANFPTT